MSTTIMIPSPAHHLSMNDDRSWQAPRSFQITEPRGEAGKLELPSFRDTFGDLLYSGTSPLSDNVRASSTNTPPQRLVKSSPTPPEYVASSYSNKRRRPEEDDGQDWRSTQIPRYYRSPEHRPQNLPPSPPHHRTVAGSETWPASARDAVERSNAPVRFVEAKNAQSYHAPMPPMPAGATPDSPHAAASTGRQQSDEYRKLPSQNGGQYPADQPGPDPRAAYQPSGYPAQQPNHDQVYDRSPFSTGGYGPQYPYGLARYVDTGYMGLNGDHKPRKRRGNLPKETTDKLRAWFLAHLSHPYPTEDEKQDLMHQTKLQMNQISNWFINARRRQLPAITSNAQTEQDVMNARREEMDRTGKAEPADYNREDQSALSLSDDDSRESPSAEDMKSWKERTQAMRQSESV